MKYVTLTNFQMFVMAIITGFIAACVLLTYRIYSDYKLLPQVHLTANGQCVKVVNFENGHAFSCPDVNVLLRRYRTETVGVENAN